MKRLAVWFLLGAGGLFAQNSDLGFLFGVSVRNASIANGVVRGETQVSLQVNYAWQLREGKGGRLYIEVPVQTAAGSSGEVGRGQVTGRAGGILFVTPGLRYHYNLSPRVVVYAAAGGGFASKTENYGFVSGNNVTSVTQTKVGGAFNVGAGLDFRLTRLWSLRGEVRSFRTTQTAALSKTSTMAQFGFALHF